MFTRIVAEFGIIVASLSLMLGNYWFTFGLWPKSWWYFAGFGLAQFTLMAMAVGIRSEGK
jgi:hypothetical protein